MTTYRPCCGRPTPPSHLGGYSRDPPPVSPRKTDSPHVYSSVSSLQKQILDFCCFLRPHCSSVPCSKIPHEPATACWIVWHATSGAVEGISSHSCKVIMTCRFLPLWWPPTTASQPLTHLFPKTAVRVLSSSDPPSGVVGDSPSSSWRRRTRPPARRGRALTPLTHRHH